jgi:small redox-active disulfide protein 2
MDIKVYGPGCTQCRRLERHAREAMKDFQGDHRITKIEDLGEMMAAGVVRTPALTVDGRLILQGRVPPVNDLRAVLADLLLTRM